MVVIGSSAVTGFSLAVMSADPGGIRRRPYVDKMSVARMCYNRQNPELLCGNYRRHAKIASEVPLQGLHETADC
jgi:hypothetical protein